MAKNLVGVIYDTRTLAIRRMIVPDEDGQLARHVGKGESLATGPLMFGRSTARAIEIVRLKTGREPV